jgi:WD40 repeat protein
MSNLPEPRQIAPESFNSIHSIAYLPDGQQVVTDGEDGTIYLRDGSSLQVIQTLPVPPVSDIALHPDGKYLAYVFQENEVDHVGVLDLTSMQVKDYGEFSGYDSLDQGDLRYGPDGSLMAISLHDVILYDPQGEVLFEISPEQLYIRANGVAFNPDGSEVAICCDHEKIIFWDTEKKQLAPDQRNLRVPDNYLLNLYLIKIGLLEYSITGNALIALDLMGNIYRWDLSHREEAPQMEHLGIPAESFVWQAALSPDQRYIASCILDTTGMDGYLIIFDLNNGIPIGRWDDQGCDNVAFSPDGKYLTVVATEAELLLRWEMDSITE